MRTKLMLILAATVLAAGCSSVPPAQTQSIEIARAHYQAAAADVQAVQAAPVELAFAEENLRRAEAAWKSGADPAEVHHLAYLANQQALIATERGKLAQAQEVIKTAAAERNKVLLEARQQALETERFRLALAQERAAGAEGIAAAQAERNAQLQKELADLAAKQTPIGMVITLDDVLFDVRKTTLKPGAERSMDRLAEFMTKYPNRKLRVEGYTDGTGSAEINQELSLQRAEVVRSELVRRGISGDRIQAVGYGPAFPVASNQTAAGRQQNRRVEIVVSDDMGNIGSR